VGHRTYRSGEFAEKVAVSVRTLRYYDKMGLLSPSRRTDSGYRLYTDEDLVRLQQILALKFLGFSLEEIDGCLRTGPRELAEVLAVQKSMMRERRTQIDTIIQAIERTEGVVQSGSDTWESIVRVLEVMQMQQNDAWHNKYFTPEQREKMEELNNESFSDEARQALAARGEWTEADQQRVDRQYAWIGAELKRLVAAGADPASPEAQAVAQLQHELLAQFAQGDPAVESGMQIGGGISTRYRQSRGRSSHRTRERRQSFWGKRLRSLNSGARKKPARSRRSPTSLLSTRSRLVGSVFWRNSDTHDFMPTWFPAAFPFSPGNGCRGGCRLEQPTVGSVRWSAQ
jgi:DNA-binding transcriptional MerR regulator